MKLSSKKNDLLLDYVRDTADSLSSCYTRTLGIRKFLLYSEYPTTKPHYQYSVSTHVGDVNQMFYECTYVIKSDPPYKHDEKCAYVHMYVLYSMYIHTHGQRTGASISCLDRELLVCAYMRK
jgi:hypothetical protein